MSILELNGLTKKFGGLTAVNDLSLNISENEIVALIGPNGAGKTTIFGTITGFYRPNMGRISFKNQRIDNLKPHSICKLGLVRTFQIVKPFMELTVFENILIGGFNGTQKLSEAIERADEALEITELTHLKNIQAGFITLADRKRLELARALATKPEIMLLDEVIAGLTPKETKDFVNLLKRINSNGVTLFIIEHVMKAVVALAQRIVVVNYGVKIAEGPPKEVLKNPEVVEAYLGKGGNIDFA